MYVAIDSRRNVTDETMNHNFVPAAIGSRRFFYLAYFRAVETVPVVRAGDGSFVSAAGTLRRGSNASQSPQEFELVSTLEVEQARP